MSYDRLGPGIGQLQYDPPSTNGEPTVDTLIQSFRFSRADAGYDEATLDSLWLTARGFFRRAEDFAAIGRLLPGEIGRPLPLSQNLGANRYMNSVIQPV